MTREWYERWAGKIGTDVERWFVMLVPVALVTISGVADVFCSVVAILFVVRALIEGDGSKFRQPWFLTLLLLWVCLCIRSIMAIHPGQSLGEAIIWLRYPVFALAAGRVLRNDNDREWFIKITAWCVLFLAADAIFQYIVGYDITARPQEGGVRLTGPFGRPRVGITIAWMFLPPLLALVERRRWLWATTLGGSSVVAIALSGERMSLATLGIDAVALVILLPHWRRQVLIAAGACVALLVLVAVAKPSVYERQINSTLNVLANLDQSQYGIIWGRDLTIAAAHPIAGVGMRNYRVVCPDPSFGPMAEAHNYPRCSTHPHNYYLEWLIAGGIPAVVAFVVAMALLLRDLLVHGDRKSLLFAGLVATILMRLWPMAPTTSFFHNWSAVPLFLIIGWALSYLPAEVGMSRSLLK